MNSIKKIIRYIFLYGLRRTLVKVLYLMDKPFLFVFLRFIYNFGVKNEERIGLIGLGNHGFTLIAFFVSVIGKKKISFVVDPSDRSRVLAEKVLKCKHFRKVDDAINSGVFYGDLVYIASDHFSHTSQAILAAKNFGKVYVEKPLFVSYEQQSQFKEIFDLNSNVFTGFNRPYAPYFQNLKNELGNVFSVSMVINGHYLPPDHWYRDSAQGSRVLGNLTHWLDLSLRILSLKEIPKSVEVKVLKGNLDDITVSLLVGDCKIDLLFSANCEPVDGVEEFIFWNSNISMGKIINFRSMDFVRKDRTRVVFKKKSKNVGHGDAVIAPLNGSQPNIQIAYLSSCLALKVEEMYVNNISSSLVSFDIWG
ncbi:hypothetical protein C0J08_03470 [Marinomonas sp. CT5]|uniref:Gfo/Idh/MocA family protein n=1 Tax=Marinomonas sp. CT5 TaxID=2066133 RepID=UPI001BAF94C7|nr:Gfo/Idh/MocA family oxidoreductase [Marinomonas sp. CT5]QUX94529.1 hypothetical protein C0J08_03470 [Marinomonas sp. CT5]